MGNRFYGNITIGGQVTKEQFKALVALVDPLLEMEGTLEEDGQASFHECNSEDFADLIQYVEEQKIALQLYWDTSHLCDAHCEVWINGGEPLAFDTDSEGNIVVPVSLLEEQRASMTINEFIESLGIPDFPAFSIVEERPKPTIVYKNKNHNVKLPVVEGKYYVVDVYSGPIAGPFDTYIQASTALSGMAIEDDCEIGECEAINAENLKFMICGIRFRASR